MSILYLRDKNGSLIPIHSMQGENGITPHIGENENWFIGDIDTGKPSRGNQGPKGDKGEPGSAGPEGADGISATHSWDGTTLTVTSASGTSSADLKGDKGDTGEAGPKGEQGPAGQNGVSITHEWDGTILKVTSASGTSSVDLKGEKGDTGLQGEAGPKGEKGDTGEQGPQGEPGPAGKDAPQDSVLYIEQFLTDEQQVRARTNIGAVGSDDINDSVEDALTRAKESGEFDGESGVYILADGETLDDAPEDATVIIDQDGEAEPEIVQITHSWNGTILTVTSASGTSSADLKGEQGAAGNNGYTPVKGTDYWTEEDKLEIKAYVEEAILGGAW